MYCDAITLFNFHKATSKWYPMVIKGVDFGSALSSKPTTQGINNEDTVVFIIKCNHCKQIKTLSGKKTYLGPKEYASCDNPYRHFTFNDAKDFIYRGEWNGDTIIDEEDYDSGLYSYMNSEFDDVYKVTLSEFFSLLPHFEVRGK